MTTTTPTKTSTMPTPTPTLRVAPSPTGYLHVGNALSAVLCAARATQQGARLLLRIEDLDGPRVMPGATDSIIRDLQVLGLRFVHDDDPQQTIMVQSTRTTAYEAALASLVERGLIYACRCSRKDLARVASAPHVGDEGPVYPGTCRGLGLPLDTPDTALRLHMARAVELVSEPAVTDLICGPCAPGLVSDVGDIVLRRKDGLYAYQLAVVVDDAAQGVTEVTRARDLLSSATRQALLHTLLGKAPPAFAHTPLLVDDDGHRLSKRSHNTPTLLGPMLEAVGARRVLGHVLFLLGVAARGAEADLDDVAAAATIDVLKQPTIAWRPIAA
jgi:glutamyl/glutaminyl-tRNA synthetase